eukprot:5738695-Prymnesium_polylepis.1
MVLLGMTDQQIRQTRRKYCRRKAKYSCPEPSIILRGLFEFDVYTASSARWTIRCDRATPS